MGNHRTKWVLITGGYKMVQDVYEWRTKLLATRNGHGQSGWSPIRCEGLYFHAMC